MFAQKIGRDGDWLTLQYFEFSTPKYPVLKNHRK